MQALRCVRCVTELPPTARYCPNCGAPADSSATASIDAATCTADGPRRSQGSLLESPALDEGRFVPGQILVDRYRIVALLGKGGMGEVYRADDLRLGQSVALKFLPERLVQDGVAQARFHREVRLARQVSHPNVCRVFDVGEYSGLPFLSMEYVDGEDLASLLTRIGRLPQDKAVDISRQICAGLSAAHEAGVLHRDLKPANIMLDRRGKARITDFGLAGLATEEGHEIRAGTPAYMAPEQLEGRAVTAQSDIYSLGLVLYEIFTGKRVFQASNMAELLRQHKTATPASPASIVQGLDPLVERVILRCLEPEPYNRPRTALQVAAALPGGDPLAAALAAGETPSPEMVAAAGGEGALELKTAWTLLGAALLVGTAIVALAPHSTDLGLAPPRKNLDALKVRAEDLIEKAGYTGPVADRAFWLERNYDFLLYRTRYLPSTSQRRNLSHAELGALQFFFRQSPRALAPSSPALTVSVFDPPQELSDMVTVVLDSNGRLMVFGAVPPQVEEIGAAVPDPNWSEMLSASGIDSASLKPAQPTWLPSVPFDRRYGWRGSYPENPKTEIQISAASYRGKPVYFHVIGPWTRPWRTPAPPPVWSRAVRDDTWVIGGFVTLVLAALFARRNIRLGRGDRRGAYRVGAFIFCTSVLAGLLIAHHVPDLVAEWQILVALLGGSLFLAAFVWLYYLALEPFVRRQWPELLISWTRLLSGRFRDPQVGRDLLAGILFGSVIALGTHALNALPGWFNVPGETALFTNPLALGSPQNSVGYLLLMVLKGIFPAFALTFTLFLTRSLLRGYWMSVAVTGFLVLLTSLGGENFALEAPFAILTTVVTMFVLLRFGILAVGITGFTASLLSAYPITLDLSKWYAPHSLFMFAVLLALLFYGLRVATGNKPLFAE